MAFTELVECEPTEVEYVPPIYRKLGSTIFIKIYDDDRMVVVNSAELGMKIEDRPYPDATNGIYAVADTVASTELEYETQRDLVVAFFNGI
jgi:hypothetical protein